MYIHFAALTFASLLSGALPMQSEAAPAALAQADTTVSGFPASTALAAGLSPESLADLSRLVAGFVEDGEVVGAELCVIKNGHTLLHEAWGWADQDDQVPLEIGAVYCVRSMTKPLVGLAAAVLIEDGKLELSDRVADFLPVFEREGLRDITIEHLLTHSSGLPLSLIATDDPRELESLRSVADLAVDVELEFAPGTGFTYSDQGTDTLTAVIEIVSGMPAAQFVEERILSPLSMHESTCIMDTDHPLRPRSLSKYAGSKGMWTRFWSPADAPLFPIFLGSQGLYSTIGDYARFLNLWLKRGRVDSTRLLRSRSIRRTLSPSPQPKRMPSGFPGLQADYGALMQLWTREPDSAGEESEAAEREVVVFGHTGSDGTHAWAFPEQNALVLYFTQSRNNSTGLRVEERLGDLLLGVPYDPLEAAPPLEEYMGFYWEGEGDLYRAVIRDGNDLALEIMGKGVVTLVYTGDDRWKMRDNPGTVLAFDRDASGTVTGYHIGEHRELRFTPDANLPAADELGARVAAVYDLDRFIAESGPVRIRSQVKLPKLGIEAELVTTLAAPNRWRFDEQAESTTSKTAFDGQLVHQQSSVTDPGTVEGEPRRLALLNAPLARYGDWRANGVNVQVLQTLMAGDEVIYVVRLGDLESSAMTLYVHADTARIAAADTMTFIEGVGRLGQHLEFKDYAEFSGLLWPRRTEVQLANPMIGDILLTVQDIEVGVAVSEGFFELLD